MALSVAMDDSAADAALQPKRSSRASTPRALVVPAPEEAPAADALHNRPSSLSSARKYQVREDDAAVDQYGLATGLPSPRGSDASARRKSDHGTPRLQPRSAMADRPAARRTLRGSLHYLKRESVLLTRQLVRSSRHLVRHLSMQQLLAYLLVLFGLVSESFTPAPRHNVPLGIVLFMATAEPSGAFSFVLDHRVVVAGLCGTTLIDFMWLLRPAEGAFNGYLRVTMENATHLSVAMCAAIKLWLVFSTYFDLGPELDEAADTPPSPLSHELAAKRGFQHRVWARARFLFPRKTLPRRSHLSYEVLMRVLGLVWIHGVCGFVLLVLGLISVMALSGKAVFRSAKLGLPLPLAILFKAASTILSYVLASHHMSYHGCLTVSGCDRLAKYYEETASDVVLKYNAKWMRRVRLAKVLDALLGVYLMAVYYSAVHSTTFIAGETVLAVLVLTAMILVVLDVWTPLLILVVARCGTVLHRHHRDGTVDVDPYYPNQLEWEDDENDKKNAKSPSSSSSSSSGESSSDSENASLSGSGSSTDDARRRRRQRQQSQRQLRSQSSSRRTLVPPVPLKRANSMLIIDASDLDDRQDLVEGTTPYWVRYWDDASGRSYLVHGLTKETVWEIGGPLPAPSSARPRSSRALTPRTAAAKGTVGLASPRNGGLSMREMTASSPALRALSPRDPPLQAASSFPPTSVAARQSPRRNPGSARASSHPTSESDVIVSTPHLANGARSPRALNSSRRTSSALLGAEDFLLLWDALPDGGNFTCRVSKVPNVEDLRHHLHTHGFYVATDGLNVASLRTIHFYAIVGAPEAPSSAYIRNAGVAFFLGEFVFDSLSLKLYAKFRCPEVDAIVPFVKKLQLKEIVGAYAPCD